MLRLNTVLLLLLAAFGVPAFAASTVRPGTINYVEGSADLGGQPVSFSSAGSVEIAPGQTLETKQGKAEVLLTPGIFLRLGANSAVQMISPDLTKTTVELRRGRAMIEVDQIFKQNDVEVIVAGVSTQLLQPGLYAFDASRNTLSVFGGKAAVREGNNQFIVVKGHRDLQLAANDNVKPHKFNVSATRDDLYNWSSLRSQYLAQENSQIAGQYAGVAGFVPGWYWDPYFWNYTFIGAGPLWSPFGWGFYPPYYYAGGFYGYGYGFRPGYAVRGFDGARGFHAEAASGGFHGGGGGGGGRR
jgi:FecR protein